MHLLSLQNDHYRFITVHVFSFKRICSGYQHSFLTLLTLENTNCIIKTAFKTKQTTNHYTNTNHHHIFNLYVDMMESDFFDNILAKPTKPLNNEVPFALFSTLLHPQGEIKTTEKWI